MKLGTPGSPNYSLNWGPGSLISYENGDPGSPFSLDNGTSRANNEFELEAILSLLVVLKLKSDYRTNVF